MKTAKVLKQYNLGNWLGFGYAQVFNTLAYLNIFMAGINLLTFWHTTMVQTRPDWLAWLSLPIFIGFILLCFMFVGLLDYKLVMPARVSFSNRQFFTHENPILSELKEIKESQKKLEDYIGNDINLI